MSLENINLAKTYAIVNNNLCLPVTNERTNVGYRIASFIHLLNGSNKLDFLSRYSQHIVESSDNMEQLRGAFGPRMRNWIGAHQLQEMINANSSISTEELSEDDDTEENIVDIAEDGTPIIKSPQYVKPEGIDQMRAVYDDLDNGMYDTSIIIRDPGVDFEESDDIPDLIAISFNGKIKNRFDDTEDTLLKVTAMYGVGNNDNFCNEVWVISLMVQMYKAHLKYKRSNLAIHCYDWNDDNSEIILNFSCDDKTYLGICDGDIQQFWLDFDMLQRFASNVQSQLNAKSFESPDVSKEHCYEILNDYFIEKIENPFFQDMAYSLAIWAFWTYGDATPIHAGDYEMQIEIIFDCMHKTSITVETAQFLLGKSLPVPLTDKIANVMTQYHGR